MPPKTTVPLMSSTLSGLPLPGGVLRLSSMPPNTTPASDLTDQLEGTISLVPPKILVNSMAESTMFLTKYKKLK